MNVALQAPHVETTGGTAVVVCPCTMGINTASPAVIKNVFFEIIVV